jgi:hypothetical protein
LSRKFCDLTASDLSRLPSLSGDHFCIGVERILLHLSNKKKMHWYLAEYGPISKKFFGFFIESTNGISSGFCTHEELLALSRKGEAWELVVDESWKTMAAKEIPSLQGYINMMICPPDNL